MPTAGTCRSSRPTSSPARTRCSTSTAQTSVAIPSEIKRAINTGLAFTEESLQQQFGAISEFVRPGVLTGTDEQVLDTIGRYVDAGADQVNIALRAPFDLDAIERLSVALGLS